MEIRQAEFVSSFTKEKNCPPAAAGIPEFAFIGRSNVGKSSLINMLTARKGLAKVSATPGKTQLLNYFIINKSWYLVDLPGYGYAKVSKVKQKELAAMIQDYLQNRPTLLVAFVLIDATIAPAKNDLDFINQLGELGVPFALVFTKTDRLGKDKLLQNIEDFKQELLKTWESLPDCFITSSMYRTGREEILNYIQRLVKRNPLKT
jgi:GTP-binding protein